MTSILKTAQTIFIACLIRLYSLQLFLMTRPIFYKLQISKMGILNFKYLKSQFQNSNV